MTGSKVQTPEETAAIVSASAIARGTDDAKSQVIAILGRGRSFIRVHVGLTDVDLGKVASERGGYKVTALTIRGSESTLAAIGKAIDAWLKTCHGSRHEATPAKPVVKNGTKTLYLALSYPAAVTAKK